MASAPFDRQVKVERNNEPHGGFSSNPSAQLTRVAVKRKFPVSVRGARTNTIQGNVSSWICRRTFRPIRLRRVPWKYLSLPFHRLVATDCGYKAPSCPDVLFDQVALAFPIRPCQMIRALALDEANPGNTADFGGIARIMRTWPGIRCPSAVSLSFCAAILRNTSPRCLRDSPFNTLGRRFGMNVR